MEDQLEDIECSSGNVTIDTKMWRDVIRKMKSWKAPGTDAIYAFWWKIFPEAQSMLKGLIEQAINQKVEIPQWMVTGQTVLIAKSENTKEPGQ